MATAVLDRVGEIEIFRHNAGIIHKVVHLNVDGITQEESLIQPQPGGNCLNWVVGHLVCVYDQVLPLVGQTAVMGKDRLKQYDRGAPQLQDSAAAIDLKDLMAAWDEAARRIDAGLQGLTLEKLDAPAPFSPANNPEETVRSLLNVIFFHQAYHAGQTGLLRRIAGKEGALR